MILDFSSLLFLFILFIPLVSGIIIVVFKRINVNQVIFVENGLIITGLISLGLLGEKTIFTALTFMREPIIFNVSNTALLLYLGNVFVLSVLIYRNSKLNRDPISRFQATLLNLSLVFGFVAFMSGQFMIRYIALDLVGLMVAMIVLNSFSDTASFKDFAIIFQVLRLGDLSLLASILLISQYSGTLDISQMIYIASNMRIGPRTWVFMGFLFAILIKLAIWPFDIWLRRARKSASVISFWISGILMPSLGYYLLYRVIPIITSNAAFRYVLLLFGLIFFFLSLFITQLRSGSYDRFNRMGSVSSCFSLLAATFISTRYIGYYFLGLVVYRLLLIIQDDLKSPIMAKLILIFPILINGLYIGINVGNLPILFSTVWLALTGFMIYWDWKKRSTQQRQDEPISSEKILTVAEPGFGQKISNFAQWLNLNLEINILSEGVVKLSESFIKFTQWLNLNLEINILSVGLVKLSESFTIFTQWLYQNLEINVFTLGFQKMSKTYRKIAAWIRENVEESFENAWIWISQKFVKISEEAFFRFELETPEKSGEFLDGAIDSIKNYERNVLKKQLQWDLALVPLFLIVILVILAIF